MLNEFNTYLDEIDSGFWEELFREYGNIRFFKKGEEFIRIGTVARHFGFIRNGSLKYSVYTTDGKEKVIGLETAGGYAASFPFCLHGQPSVVSIIANTDSELYCLSVARIKELIKEDMHVKQLVEESLNAIFYTLYNRHIQLYALTPKERYEQLLHRCPQLFEIFQLKDIASFLNITRQHLDRLKKSVPM